jgi:hypothetical protein
MPIVLPILPEPSPGETGAYCVIGHRALPGRADAYEQRMLADLENTRAEPGVLRFCEIMLLTRGRPARARSH